MFTLLSLLVLFPKNQATLNIPRPFLPAFTQVLAGKNSLLAEDFRKQETSSATSLIADGDFSAKDALGWNVGGISYKEVVPVTGMPFAQAVSLGFSDPPTGNPWDIVFNQPFKAPIQSGETVSVSAYVRSNTVHQIGINFEQSHDPYSKFLSVRSSVTPEWKKIKFAAKSQSSYKIGDAQLTFYLGFGKGTIEIADVHVDDLGNTPVSQIDQTFEYFGGQPNPSSWRAAAYHRIEKYRKGPMTIKVVDSNGRPVSGAKVSVLQLKHQFHFGTAVPATFINGTDPDSIQMRSHLRKMFNAITFENDLKWHQVAPEDPTPVETALKWLKEYGFAVRGHNLVWGSQLYIPKEVWALSDNELREAIHARITNTVKQWKGQLFSWDVVNEAVSEHELWDRIGWSEFAEAYKLARAADPKTKLCYNDYDITEETAVGTAHRKKTEQKIRYLIVQKAPLDVLGFQSHIGLPMTPAIRVVEILKEMEKFHLPMEITEFDIGITDDKVQANYLDDYLTAAFAEPLMQGFSFWGFWEGAEWRASEGGFLVKKDWTHRLSADVWMNLTHKVWWTKANLVTSHLGKCALRGFYGDYLITVTKGNISVQKKVSLLKGSQGNFVISFDRVK